MNNVWIEMEFYIHLLSCNESMLSSNQLPKSLSLVHYGETEQCLMKWNLEEGLTENFPLNSTG